MMKKLWIVLVVLALCGSLTTFAAEIPDVNQPGSLTLTMNWDGEPLDTGSITAYHVGEIVKKNGDYTFALLPQLEDSNVVLELEDPEIAGTLALLVVERNMTPITASIKDGKVVLDDLTPGLYLVLQTDTQVSQGFAPIRPFLISLPRWVEDHYVYNITAAPKVPLETIPTEPTEPPATEPPTEPPEPDLPQTGQLNWPVPILVVLGLFFFVGGWILQGKHGGKK